MRGTIAPGPEAVDRVIEQLRSRGVALQFMAIDRDEYARYLDRAAYTVKYPFYYGGETGKLIEKTVEHYLAAKLLDLSPNDVYIDVATANSCAPDIYRELYGCTVYRQDLIFKTCRGDRLAGDAAEMPVGDGFATKMALHCSFEHFEGDSDTRFIKEAQRVLRSGGRLCIVPLYLNDQHAVQIDPIMFSRGLPSFDAASPLYCARGYRLRHGRFYSGHTFADRILSQVGSMKASVYVVTNETGIDPRCPVKFIAFFEKP